MDQTLARPTPELGALVDAEPEAPRKRSRWRRFRGVIGATVVFVVLIGVWQLAVERELVNDIILPPPWEVAVALRDTLTERFFYTHLWITAQEVLLGFVLGSAIGLALGAALSVSSLLREVSYPYIVAFQGLPKIVLAPVFVTAFGFGMTSKVVMATVLCFFPVLVNTLAGLTSVDTEAKRLMRSLTANRRQMFTKLALPHALPMVFAGLKTALTFALVGAIVGEFIGAPRGLGVLLSTYSYQLQIARMWAVTIVLAVMGVILFLAIEWLDRKVVFWRSERDLSVAV
jgi:NitT/TauT family transport system permease protein